MFQLTRAWERATAVPRTAPPSAPFQLTRAWERATCRLGGCGSGRRSFNSRALGSARPWRAGGRRRGSGFNSRALGSARLRVSAFAEIRARVSTHARLGARDAREGFQLVEGGWFQLTRAWERATSDLLSPSAWRKFQLTRAWERATGLQTGRRRHEKVSTHARLGARDPAGGGSR